MRLLPLIILVLFSLVDAAANWRLIPAETVSEWVWSLGWVGRACAAVVLIALFGHIVLQWPLGPTAHDRRTSEPVAVAFGLPALPDPVRSRVADDPRRPDSLDRARRGSIHDPR